jgi:hypothetical protein
VQGRQESSQSVSKRAELLERPLRLLGEGEIQP